MMQEEFGIPRQETERAVAAAYSAYDAYVQDVRQTGMAYIEYARAHEKNIVVLCGRPYHIDPEINHGINDLITSFGFVVVTEDALSYLEDYAPPRCSTSGPSRAVCITPLGTSAPSRICRWCSWSPSAAVPTPSPPMRCAPFWRRGGKLYTQLKIDDINNLGAVKIRIRSLMAAMDARKVRPSAQDGAAS